MKSDILHILLGEKPLMDKRPDLYRFSRGKRKCVDQKMFKEVHTGAHLQPSLMALQFDDGQVCKLCFCPVIVCKIYIVYY